MKSLFSYCFPKAFPAKFFVCIASAGLFLALSPTDVSSYETAFPLVAAFIVFYLMMHEDYYEHTIDAIFTALLVFCLFFASGHGLAFWLAYILSISSIQAIYHFSAVEYSEGGDVDICTAPIESNCLSVAGPYGWLPSFGVALLSFFFLSHILGGNIPSFLLSASLGLEALVSFFAPQGMPPKELIFSVFLLWIVLEERNRRKEERGILLLYRFGDGDGYVLSAFIAFLGLQAFLAVFFLNMIFLLLYGLPAWMSKSKHRQDDKQNIKNIRNFPSDSMKE